MKDIVIASFYKFVLVQDFETLREPMLDRMHQLGIKGTIILAQEGINGSFAGLREPMTSFYAYLQADPRWADLHFKETFDDKNPFEKSKVKLRKEIVSMGSSTGDPNQYPNTHLNPQEWHELIQDPEVLVLDTRNIYEYELGTFQNAINPNTDNFREFPQYVKDHLSDKKDKTIAMFCTGGIRCEKTTAFMKDLGFEKVYQLKDGILNYIESIPEQESLWKGECFVFDNRVGVDKHLNRVYPQLPEDYKDERYPK